MFSPLTTGNPWNMTVGEYNASIHLQATLCCIVWLLLSCRFLLPPPHVVLPFKTGNVWNMAVCEYNAPIHLQVTLHCIVWLLLSCHFLLPLMLFSRSQLGMHGTWQWVSIMHPFIWKWHCVALCGCYYVAILSFLSLMLFSLHKWECMEHDRKWV